MNKFPEAFNRFVHVVDISDVRTLDQLRLIFEAWAGRGWIASYKQNISLELEGAKRGISGSVAGRIQQRRVSWVRAPFRIHSRPQTRYRDVMTGRFIRKPEE